MAKAFTNIRVFNIAETKVNEEVVRAWLLDLGADEFESELDMHMDGTPDAAQLVALAAKQCYMAFQPSLNPNLTKVRKDMTEYLDNVLKQKHGSVLTHAVFTFGINGCSRVFTGEMNRHSVGTAISERSMRYVRYEDIEYWMPGCFREEGTIGTPAQRARSRDIMKNMFETQELAMLEFSGVWKDQLAGNNFHVKKVLTSAFRRVIGMGIATGGVWSLNLRALRHVCALRTDPSAEEEAVHVIGQVGRYMIERLPQIFGDFKDVDGALVPEYWKV